LTGIRRRFERSWCLILHGKRWEN